MERRELTSICTCVIFTLIIAHTAFAAPARRLEQNGVVRWLSTPVGQTPAFFEKLAQAGVDVPPNDRPFERTIAFLVGVSQYDHLRPQLPGVATDIEDLRKALLDVAGFDEVIILLNEHATRESIEDFLIDEFRKMNRKDRLLIYFAGHGADAGGNTGYFQLQKAQANSFARHTLRIGDAREWIALIPAHHVLVIFDACASGLAFATRAGTSPDDERDTVNTLSGRGSRTIITAGTGAEDTLEIEVEPGKPTGAFTRSFITALKSSKSRFSFLTTDRVLTEAQDHLVSILNKVDGSRMTPRKWDLDTTAYGGQFLFLNPSWRGEDPISPSVMAALRARGTSRLPSSMTPPVSWREMSLRLGDLRVQASRYRVELGAIPNSEPTELSLQVTNEAHADRTISIRVNDPRIEASWDGGSWVSPVPSGASGNLRLRVLPAAVGAESPGEPPTITFLKDDLELASIAVSYTVQVGTIARETLSGPRPSGVRNAFGQPHTLCLGSAPPQYDLVPETARFWLTGDRSCGSWSTCEWTRRDNADVCFQFSLQGHDENPFDPGVRESEGHLRAEYRLVRQAPRLTAEVDRIPDARSRFPIYVSNTMIEECITRGDGPCGMKQTRLFGITYDKGVVYTQPGSAKAPGHSRAVIGIPAGARSFHFAVADYETAACSSGHRPVNVYYQLDDHPPVSLGAVSRTTAIERAVVLGDAKRVTLIGNTGDGPVECDDAVWVNVHFRDIEPSGKDAESATPESAGLAPVRSIAKVRESR